MIGEYTQEAGLRQLEREIGKVCRKVARKKAEIEGEFKPLRVTAENLQGFSSGAEDLYRGSAEKGPDRHRYGPGVDGCRRRYSVYRGAQDKGQRKLMLDRPARRGHAGIGAGGIFLCKGTCERTRTSREDSRELRHSYSLARRSDPEGRPECRHYDGDRPGFGPCAAACAKGRRDDRRDHFKGQRPAGRRSQRKAARGPSGEDKNGYFARANRRDLEDLPQEVRDDLTFIFVENVRQVFDEALREPKPGSRAAKRARQIIDPSCGAMISLTDDFSPWFAES